MQKYFCLAATILIVAIIAFGCSTGSSPTAPVLRDNLAPRDSSGIGQTGLVGLWQVAIDLNNQTIEAVPARTSDLMLNVLGFMEPPALDKMTIDFDTLVIDFENTAVEVDVVLTHPLVTPDNVFQGFDVRGIVFGPTMLNPDGYTAVMNPADFEDVPFGYMDGLLGIPNSFANYDADYWPYKYFCDDLDLTTELWDFYYNHADIAAHRGMFSEGNERKRHYSLSWDGLTSPLNFLVYNYAVYANFDWAVGDTPFTNDEYSITSANSAEAFCLSYDVTDNSLTYFDGSGGGDISLDIRVWDWQGLGSTEVTIESIELGVIAPVMEDTFGPGSDPFDGIVSFIDVPGVPTSVGDLDILVTVTDNSMTYGGAWFFGMLPTDHDFFALPVESYWIITVPVAEEPSCPTVEPVDIEAAPYNGVWLDPLDEDTACACEVSNSNGTDLEWTHDPGGTCWLSGNVGGVYDDDMDVLLIGPQILAPSTGAVKFECHFDSDIEAGEYVRIGFKVNDDPPIFVLGQGNPVTDYIMDIKFASLDPGDVISWVMQFESDDVDNSGIGCTLWDMTSSVFDPGPMPVISDGGTPDPANEVCTTGNVVTFGYIAVYHVTYRWFTTSSMPISWSWVGSPVIDFIIGDTGYMLPSSSVSDYKHRPCDLTETYDQIVPFGDHQAVCQNLSYFPEHSAECAGEVREQGLDIGTDTERWVLEWCDVGQITEADTCHWRLIINGSNNTNPNDMRVEYIDVGSHVNDTADSNTGSWLCYNAVFIPIHCDWENWASYNNTAMNIDMP